MRPPRLFRTSAFRLALGYAAAFALSVLVLFAIVEWSASGFMRRQIDRTVGNEIDEVRADAAAPGSLGMAQIVAGLTRNSPGLAYLLEAPNGRTLAGNLPAMTPRAGVRALRERRGGIRGRGVLLGSGEFLFVGMSDFEVHEMREAIARAFGAGFALVLALSTACGLITGLSVLRRVEGISQASREIMAGDLGRRIARDGSGDEFDHLAGSLNSMLERIEALMTGLAQVSRDIAHDLRTPLGRLRQRLERAREREVTVAGLQDALDASIKDVDGILEIFGALLRIAQIESGSRRAGFGTVALSRLLDELAEAYLPVADERGQPIARDIEPGLMVTGDRELLTQLFANLIENAIGHTPEGTRIAILAAQVSGGVEAVVADAGPGIAEGLRGRVLMPFFRLEASRTSSGSGLGLGMVAAIAALHDATLSLEDNGPGLRCRVRLTGVGAGEPQVRSAPREVASGAA